MDTSELKKIFVRYQLKPNFTYGQNFLIDDEILEQIADSAELTASDCVLEIGPGIGNLTELLCQRAGFVLSVEKDPKFYPILKAIKKQHKNNFQFEIADALKFDYVSEFYNRLMQSETSRFSKTKLRPENGMGQKSGVLSAGYKVVANIPYYITGKILQNLLASSIKPKTVTILTQKEVAKNITAKAGNMSVLAISVQLYGDPKIIQIVPAKSFYPEPKVDSAILKIEIFNKPKFDVADEKKFFRILKACYSGKRKQIHNTMRSNLGLDKNRVLEVLARLNIQPTARPQELSIEQWVSLSKLI
jgi:16S rRNA (adenine1518-N6/adenine1519-N6)-dimethyltransferase